MGGCGSAGLRGSHRWRRTRFPEGESAGTGGQLRRPARWCALAVALVCLTLVALVGVGSGVASAAANWSSPQSIDPSGGGLGPLSCPSSTFCMATDAHANALTYSSGAWSSPQQIENPSNPADPSNPYRPTAVSCVSASFCMAGDNYGRAITYTSGSWSSPQTIDSSYQPVNSAANSQLMSVSCPSTTFCMALDSVGNFLTYQSGTWSAPQAVETQAYFGYDSLSCASSTFCVAVDVATDMAYMYENGSWTADALSPPEGTVLNMNSVSCPTITFCVATDRGGTVFTYQNGSWDSGQQVDTTASEPWPVVSCATATFCQMVDAGGNAFGYDSGSAPSVGTGAASAAQTTWTVSGTVNPNGSTVTGCRFDYGTTTSYGSSVPCPQSVGSGTSPVSVSASLSGLSAGTIYHYRLEATNGSGTGYGSDATFTTASASSSGGGGGTNSGSSGGSGGGTSAACEAYTLPVGRFELATEPPDVFSLPFGWALQPLLSFGLVGGGTAVPRGGFVNFAGPFGDGNLSLATLTLDANGAKHPLLGPLKLNWDGLAVSGPSLPQLPTDENVPEPLGSYVALPLISVTGTFSRDQDLGPFALGLCGSFGAQLAVRLYLFQAAAYVAEKVLAGAVADASTDGIATPVVIAVLRNQVLNDVLSFVTQLEKIAENAKQEFNLTMSVAAPVGELLGMILNAGVHYVAPYIHKAVAYVLGAVARWAGQQVAGLVNGAGAVWGATIGRFAAFPGPAGFAGQQVGQLGISRRRLAAGRLRVASYPRTRAQAVSVAAALLQYGRGRATIRPLFTSSAHPVAGQLLSIAGGHLTRFGRALIELTGPGYAAQRLVATREGTAAEVIILPKMMRPGRWTLGILDYSGSARGAPVRIDGMSWIVHAPKRRRHRKPR